MKLPVAFRRREPPLPPCAVIARGQAARGLARSLLARDDATLGKLRGASAPELLLVLGDAADLPWADGAEFLGRDERAPALLLPTLHETAAHPALLERALIARHPGALLPLAVLPEAKLVVPAGAALPIDRGHLRGFVGDRSITTRRTRGAR